MFIYLHVIYICDVKMNEYYEKYRGSGLWSEWVKIGKCDNCGDDVYDVHYVEGEGLFCDVKCSLEYYKRSE